MSAGLEPPKGNVDVDNKTVTTPEGQVHHVTPELSVILPERNSEPSDTAHIVDEDDIDEEILTQCTPPTEIVDTVVTMTTNPDGSLKRTTRRTTRTMVTTTRVRRIKTKPSVSPSEPIGVPNEPSEGSQNETQPTLYTVVGSRSESLDEHGKSRITQAAFSFLAPTTKTEVTYDEGEQDIESADLENILHASQRQSEENKAASEGIRNVNFESKKPKAHTKTTVRKTLTSSAAAATFVTTGTTKVPGKAQNEDLSDFLQQKTNPDEYPPNETSVSSFCVSHPTGTKVTTTTKRTTKASNSLATRSILFTRSSLESLRKPFNLWAKDCKLETGTHAAASPDNSATMDTDDTEQLALRTMKESERMFSEANLLLPTNRLSLANDGGTNQIVVCPSTSDHGDTIRFQSRFANLPLYQGYGLIAQQLAQFKQQQEEKANETTTNTTSSPCTTEKPMEIEFPEIFSDWLFRNDVRSRDAFPCPPGFELNAATNALVSMLDESTDRLLKNEPNQWYDALQKASTDLRLIAPDKTALNKILQPFNENEKRENYDNKNEYSEVNYIPGETPSAGADKLRHSSPAISASQCTLLAENASGQAVVENAAQPPSPVIQPDWRTLGRLGAPSKGAFRVAWSEMPEVVNSDALKLLTKHEIQLQEAMFEVITTEASYYQSLNVLVRHYYHAPEFNCNSSPPQSGQTTKIDPTTPGANNQLGPSTALSTSPEVASLAGADVECNSTSGGSTNRRPLLKPLEKHHLFSNVLLVCLASEKFLQDLETRWTAQMPIVHEICDLIVKHAGGATFEPYITYLRNEAYQMETLRKLCQRDSFRAVLDNLQSNPISGKNSIDSFLALPMQRLTRLKLLVEVIRRLQDAVIQDAADAECTKPPFRIPTDRERENVQLALRELHRLLASSETEKELMDQKARLLTLSNSLEFPDNVKCVPISDKRLIKEGEMREVALNGRMTMLQKLSWKKPQSFYVILFNDLLLVTRKKKNDRYLVLDYCERAEIHAEIQRIGSGNFAQSPSTMVSKSPQSTDSLHKDLSGHSGTETTSNALPHIPRSHRPKTTTDFRQVQAPGTTSPVRKNNTTYFSASPDRKNRISLGRSGSSLSSFITNSSTEKSRGFGYPNQNSSVESTRAECIRLILNTSQLGTVTELHLFPKNSEDFSGWCKALAISPISLLQSSLVMDNKRPVDGKTYHPGPSRTIRRRTTITGAHCKTDLRIQNTASPNKKASFWSLLPSHKHSSFRRPSKSNSPRHTNVLHLPTHKTAENYSSNTTITEPDNDDHSQGT